MFNTIFSFLMHIVAFLRPEDSELKPLLAAVYKKQYTKRIPKAIGWQTQNLKLPSTITRKFKISHKGHRNILHAFVVAVCNLPY